MKSVWQKLPHEPKALAQSIERGFHENRSGISSTQNYWKEKTKARNVINQQVLSRSCFCLMKNGLDLPEELVRNIPFKTEMIPLMFSAGSKNESVLCRSNFLEGKLNVLHSVSFLCQGLGVFLEEASTGPHCIQKALTGSIIALQGKRVFYFCFQAHIVTLH